MLAHATDLARVRMITESVPLHCSELVHHSLNLRCRERTDRVGAGTGATKFGGKSKRTYRTFA